MMELNLTRLDYLQVCKAILASMDTSTARLSKVFWGITFIYFFSLGWSYVSQNNEATV